MPPTWVAVDDEIFDRIKRYAKEMNLSVGAAATAALEDWLNLNGECILFFKCRPEARTQQSETVRAKPKPTRRVKRRPLLLVPKPVQSAPIADESRPESSSGH
jgi:hypothetical protein